MSWFGGGGATSTSTPTTSAAPFSLGLGGGTTTAPITSATPFSFGLGGGTTTAPTTSAAPFSFGLGGGTTTAPTTSATPISFGFGAGATPAPITSAAPIGFGFGGGASVAPPTTSVAPMGFGFGSGTTSVPATSVAPVSFGFGGGATASVPATSVAPVSFGLGGGAAMAPTTSVAPVSFGFGGGGTASAPATSVAPFISFGLGGAAASSAPATSANVNVLSQTVSAGLGGMAASSINSFGMGGGTGNAGPGNSSSIRGDQRSVKELPMPTELLVLVEELKNHMRNEKVKMAEVSRASYRTMEHVSSVMDDTRATILNISNIIQRQTHNCDAFRQQIIQDFRDAEMAQMTRETPAALQADNYLPTEYFFRVLADYENRMMVYMREIRKAESAIAALEAYTPVNAQDLCMSLKSVRDSLVVIAATVKTLHERVITEVETHRNLLRFVQGDTGRDIFAEKANDQFNRWDQKTSEATSSVIFPSRVTDPARLYMNYMAGTKESSSYNNLLPGSSGFGRPSTFSPSRYPQSYAGYGSTTLYQSPSSLIFNPYCVTSPPPSTVSPLSLKRPKL